MKKFRIIFLLTIIIILTAATILPLASCSFGVEKTEYFRIHVRANSNDERDQSIKYAVRDEAVEFLTPLVEGAKSVADAKNALSFALEDLEKKANALLKKEGFPYLASARITREYFPTRVYEGLTLNAGEYLALIIELGKGEGQNWWCVVYPPLCFSHGGGDIVYKSKLAELFGW